MMTKNKNLLLNPKFTKNLLKSKKKSKLIYSNPSCSTLSNKKIWMSSLTPWKKKNSQKTPKLLNKMKSLKMFILSMMENQKPIKPSIKTHIW